MKRSFSVTDRPLDPHRAPDPSASPGPGPSFGGTLVTNQVLTDPPALAKHMQQNVPPLAGSLRFLTEIEVPGTELNPDPTTSNPPPGTYWIKPSATSVRITRTWEVIEVYDASGVRLIYRPVTMPGSDSSATSGSP